MLKNLIEIQKFEGRPFWDYYNIMNKNVLEDINNAHDFIKFMFKNASKEALLEMNDFEYNDELHLREEHALRVFYLGAYIQRQIDNNLQIISYMDEQYPFSYFWYLCCLSHDFGYIYEEMNIIKDELYKIYAVKERNKHLMYNSRLLYYRKKRMKINMVAPSFSVYNKCYLRGFYNNKRLDYYECSKMCKNHIVFNNGITVKKCRYTNKLKNNYFWYALRNLNHLDHGIVGADLFFSRLVDIYKASYINLHNGIDIRNFVDKNNRYFNCELLKIFAYIADCIASHNIWKARKKDEELYNNSGLNELVGQNFKRINYEDNPLLFVLCLADSIEPTKKIHNIDENIVLENIDIEYNSDIKKLNLRVTSKFIKLKQCKEYIRGVSELEDWMNIHVNIDIVNTNR